MSSWQAIRHVEGRGNGKLTDCYKVLTLPTPSILNKHLRTENSPMSPIRCFILLSNDTLLNPLLLVLDYMECPLHRSQ